MINHEDKAGWPMIWRGLLLGAIIIIGMRLAAHNHVVDRARQESNLQNQAVQQQRTAANQLRKGSQ